MLRYMFLGGFVQDPVTGVVSHEFPMLLPCNYAKKAKTIVGMAQERIREFGKSKGWSDSVVNSWVAKVHLVTSETNKQEGSFAKRLMANPGDVGPESILVASTYAMQAGVSLESHFRTVFCFFYPNVGTFDCQMQAANRLRDWERYDQKLYICAAPVLRGAQMCYARFYDVACVDMMEHKDRMRAARASLCTEEGILVGKHRSLWLDWMKEHNIPTIVLGKVDEDDNNKFEKLSHVQHALPSSPANHLHVEWVDIG
jgi:hypothetical protein